jgi:hypothetical protein
MVGKFACGVEDLAGCRRYPWWNRYTHFSPSLEKTEQI